MSTPPGPKPLIPQDPSAYTEPRPDDAPRTGVAPPKGEMLEAGVQQPAAPAPRPGPSDPTIREGAIYQGPDGEERLVWVIRNGVAEYFARRDGGRWTGTVVDRGLLTTEEFAREVGLG